ncbi:MAG: hypothetical protein FWH26_00535 [Oscillospiraceae bacterium]|nr:hypothetical protein [Oscillospiraceae bacterium]
MFWQEFWNVFKTPLAVLVIPLLGLGLWAAFSKNSKGKAAVALLMLLGAFLLPAGVAGYKTYGAYRRQAAINLAMAEFEGYASAEMTPEQQEKIYVHAQALLEAGDYEYALVGFRKINRYKLSDCKKAMCYFYLGDYEAALNSFGGVYLQTAEEYEEAGIVCCEFTVQLQKEAPELYYRYLQRTLDFFNYALEIEPDRQQCRYYRGLIWYYLEAYGQAILDLDRALELDPGDVRAAEMLEVIYALHADIS